MKLPTQQENPPANAVMSSFDGTSPPPAPMAQDDSVEWAFGSIRRTCLDHVIVISTIAVTGHQRSALLVTTHRVDRHPRVAMIVNDTPPRPCCAA